MILGVYTVVWGLWVANPFWAVFTQANLFSALAGFAPEWAWGLNALFCGSVTAYGAYKRSYRSLVTGSLVAFFHWFVIAAFYFAGDALNTGGITSLTFAVYSAYIYLNVRVNFKSDRKNAHLLQ